MSTPAATADAPGHTGGGVGDAADPTPATGRQVAVRGAGLVYRSRNDSLRALDPIDLVAEAGQVVGVVGPSGCGKTTLLQIVAGFLAPTEGDVLLGDAPVTGPSPDLGVVFQQPNLYPWLTVRGNVEFGPRMRGARRAARREISDRQLELVGLSDVADMRPYELSGGMQQRCQIARVLANEPGVLLMDEPFGALDALTRERLQDELLRVRAATGATVLFVTHGVEEAAYLCDRVVVLSERPGRIVFDEPSPFAGRTDRPVDARSRPEFIRFRDRIRRHIGATPT